MNPLGHAPFVLNSWDDVPGPLWAEGRASLRADHQHQWSQQMRAETMGATWGWNGHVHQQLPHGWITTPAQFRAIARKRRTS